MKFVTGVSLLGSAAASPLWPQPYSAQLGESSLTLASDFTFKQSGAEGSAFLTQAIDRYVNLIAGSSNKADASESALSACSVTVAELHDDEPSTLQAGVDESYSLSIDAGGACAISSQTVWGALHGMETFTQLLQRSEDAVTMPFAPVVISDAPRFTHRGLLIDSSRHYLPVSEIERLIDSLPMSKFNVLHWHMVDAQVLELFPFCTYFIKWMHRFMNSLSRWTRRLPLSSSREHTAPMLFIPWTKLNL